MIDGINDLDLEKRIIQLCWDARMFRDKLYALADEENKIGSDDGPKALELYFNHILSIELIKETVNLGKSKFPYSNVSWDKYLPREGVPSFKQPDEIIKLVRANKGSVYKVNLFSKEIFASK